MQRKFDRIAVVLIDAMRADFGIYEPHLPPAQTPFYKNKLPVIHELLTSGEGLDAHMFRFVADSPTTTTQRLKGLTTGSLPTFIDAGENFAAQSVVEDNWIKRANENGLVSVMLGDNTLLYLYPGLFDRQFGFYSFDVADLHSVDNGILQNLYSELEKSDWNVLVAHFLGVDHAGHRFGPNHPEMASKLSQMDEVLREVANTIDNTTLLVVMGDHGMTSSGEHGGDSSHEVNSFLFTYTPSSVIASSPDSSKPGSESGALRDVSQIDLVPTISLLLGLPIPFSSLGSVIPEMFASDRDNNRTLLEAMRLNSHQLHRYLDAYAKTSQDLPSAQLEQLTTDFETLEKGFHAFVSKGEDGDAQLLQNEYEKYFQKVQSMCREVWAKLDLVSMSLGVVVLALSLLPILSFLLDNGSSLCGRLQRFTKLWPLILTGGTFGLLCGIPLHLILATKGNEELPIFLCFGSALGSVFAFVYFERETFTKLSPAAFWTTPKSWIARADNASASFLVLLQCVGSFSSSYITYEDGSVNYLLISLYVVYFCIACRRLVESESKLCETNTPIKWEKFKVVGVSALLAVICCRAATCFHGCFEMKVECERSSFLTSLAAVRPLIGSLTVARYVVSCSCVALFPAVWWFMMKRNGQLNGNGLLQAAVSYGLPVSVACVWIYWALQFLPAAVLDRLPNWQHTTTPRIVYVISAITVLVILVGPNVLRAVNGKPHFNQLERSVALSNRRRTRLSHFSVLWVNTWLVLTLLQGDGLAPAMLLFALQAAFTINFIALLPNGKHKSRTDVSWCDMVMWTTLSYHYFYCTGHQPLLSDIRFEAAFVGLRGAVHGVFSTALSTFLILLNTFTSQTLCVVGLPLLLFAKQRLSSTAFSNVTSMQNGIEGGDKGPLLSTTDVDSTYRSICRLCLLYTVCRTFKVMATVVASVVLRIHLYTWRLFAPRFLYEVVGFMYEEVLLLVIFLFVVALDNRIRSQ
ncbi:GPI ethanolamine phosphate transferase 3-like [Corticium candelabrum]|uniref:GPI ethanolamine phosphate transferase 3-like n=1 Tax=Corticium candelabrum TaxID=121492 RepID=UPI002E255401|nr:GPI ethanolamine phosphate transferase 3-like [Corticium candelabrum]